MGETILRVLSDTWQGYVHALSIALPRVLAMATVVLAGWLIAALVRALTLRVLVAMRLSRLSERAGVAELLRKAELPAAERMLASAVFWLLFAGFVLAGLDAMGLATLDGLRADLWQLAPRLFTSAAVLVVGVVFANVAWRLVLLAAVNAGWPSARLVAGTAHGLLVILAVAMALDHLGLARGVVVTAFAIIYGAVLLTVAIAVGIAAAPLVRRRLEELFESRGRGESGGGSHL